MLDAESSMRLFDAIVDANHRAAAGDQTAGIRPAEFADSLPVVALTCIDPRLNPLIPEVLGIPEEQFIWLRNAGNIITSPTSSTVRSLALACAVKGGREIAIIGHTDCRVRQTTILELTERFRAMGIDRARLPDNLTEYFGVFASERQNVIRGVELARSSPLIGPGIPVHGLLVDLQSGRLEWIVNGYQSFATTAGAAPLELQSAPPPLVSSAPLQDFKLGEMKFPESKIGEGFAEAGKWMAEVKVIPPSPPAPPEGPPKLKGQKGKPAPVPPPLRLQQPWKKRSQS
jgi:carbonic anhydrase